MNIQDLEFKEKLEFFKKHIFRHYLNIEDVPKVLIHQKTIIIHDLYCKIDFHTYTTIVTYNILDDMKTLPEELEIHLDHKGFFEIYPVLFAYIRDFNKRNN